MKKMLSMLTAMFILVVITSCNVDTVAPAQSGTGSVTFTFSCNQSKTLVPGISMVPAGYSITGTGPGGSSFSVSTNENSTSCEYRVVDREPPLLPVTFEFDPAYPEAGQTVNVRITSSEYLFDPSVTAIGPIASYKGYDREYLFNDTNTTTNSFNFYNLPGNDYQIVFYEQGMEKGMTSLNVSGSLYPFLTVSPENPVCNEAATFYAVSNEPHAFIHLIVTGSNGQVYDGNDWGWELINGLYWWHWAYNTLPEENYFDCTLTIEGIPRAEMRIFPQ